MPMQNADMASVFEQIADLLEIQGANPFRVRAYRNAARSVGEFGKSVPAMIEQNEDVKRIAGIGDDLAGKLREIAATGTCTLLTSLRAQMPAAITELLQVQGLGPKRVRALYEALHVRTIAQLREAAEQGLIRSVPGFGEKTQAHILERFVGYDEARQVLARGDTRSSVVLASGIQVDLRVVEPDSFEAALVYFTGSKAHNIAMRRIAQGFGLTINEYGLELDAQPKRLDLADTYCRMAKAEGVLIAIDSDAHDTLGFDDLRHGVDQARRGWLEKNDVVNTRGLDALRPLLRASTRGAETTPS